MNGIKKYFLSKRENHGGTASPVVCQYDLEVGLGIGLGGDDASLAEHIGKNVFPNRLLRLTNPVQWSRSWVRNPGGNSGPSCESKGRTAVRPENSKLSYIPSGKSPLPCPAGRGQPYQGEGVRKPVSPKNLSGGTPAAR